MIKLKELIKVVSFPVWIYSDCEESMYCKNIDDFLKKTNAGMWRKEVKYITTDAEGDLTIEI